jgi:hypothetical protein
MSGVVQYGLGGLTPAWHAPRIVVGVCEPYAVEVPYWKKYFVGSPPATPAPTLPFNLAEFADTLVAGRVTALGGTFLQYGPVPPPGGGVCPGWQTIVAPAGVAENATTAAATKPPNGASRPRYLII